MRFKPMFFIGIVAIMLGGFFQMRISPLGTNHNNTQFAVDNNQATGNSASAVNIPLQYQSDLAANYYNLNPEFETVWAKINSEFSSDQTLDNRDPSIFATWLAVETLLDFNYTEMMETNRREKTIQYLVGQLNASMKFSESINYSRFLDMNIISVDSFLVSPYTPDVIHASAIITLGKLGALSSEFSPAQLASWKASMIGSMRPDGGYGSRIKNEQIVSTIVETYFAVAALQQLLSIKPSLLFHSNFQSSIFLKDTSECVYRNAEPRIWMFL